MMPNIKLKFLFENEKKQVLQKYIQSDPDKMGQAIYFYNEKVEQS